MSALASHKSSTSIHALVIGNNGSGKTGALTSLAKAGYKLRILDFDGGTEILGNLLKGDPAIDNVDVETFVDKYAPQPGSGALRPLPQSNAFEKAMGKLTKWGDYGSPMDWGPDTVLVIDSLTMMGKAAMNQVFKMKGKLVSLDPKDFHPSQPDWGDAMGLQENLCAMLMGLACNVIVTAHVTYLSPDGETAQMGFPSALGSKLPPKIGSYFNSTLFVGGKGLGLQKTRVIFTKSSGVVATKTSAPGLVKDDYPLETGMADYFNALLGPLKADKS